MSKNIIRNKGFYTMYVTREQVNTVLHLNERFGESISIGDNLDALEVVDLVDLRVGMICGTWGNIVIGILPDGSPHS